MRFSMRNLLSGLAGAAVLLLAACGGGGGGDDDGGSAVKPPSAVATADAATVHVGTPVTLDGSASSTPNGGALTYAWRLSSKPEGSAGVGARIELTATSPNPIALVLPREQTVLRGSTVTLDGSRSLPPTGGNAGELRYQWELFEQPDGEPVTLLSNATTAQASFLAEKTGSYRARLVVSHGDKVSAPAEALVKVNTGNSAPVIKLPDNVTYDAAGNAVLTAVRGDTVTLDASASHDPDGDSLHYRWFFELGRFNTPTGSQAAIQNHTESRASFVPDAVGKYNVELTVYDDSVASTQKIIIDVAKPAGAANIAPVAAFAQNVDCERGAWGCAVYANESYDLDGDPLTYEWTFWNVADPGGTTQRTTTGDSSLYLHNFFDNKVEGTYHVEVVAVDEARLKSEPVSTTKAILNAPNQPPTAGIAVALEKVMVMDTIEFDGSGSSDPNGNRLSYAWTLVDRPDGSSATLQGATSEKASVVADKPGIYTAMLRVTDSGGLVSYLQENFSKKSVFAKQRNNPPVVSSAGLSRSNPNKLPGQPYIFSSESGNFLIKTSATFIDPDNDDPLDYLITTIRQPQGSSLGDSTGRAQLDSVTGLMTGLGRDLITDIPGDYEFQVIASDGISPSEPKTFAITIVKREDYPTLLLETVGIRYVLAPDKQSVIPVERIGGPVPFPVVPEYAGFNGSNSNTDLRWRYILTAVDQNYTITDLQVTSDLQAAGAAIEGLGNGQFIAKGSSVRFDLVWPKTDPVPTGVTAAHAKFSFRIAEKPGYTFDVENKREFCPPRQPSSTQTFPRPQRRAGLVFPAGGPGCGFFRHLPAKHFDAGRKPGNHVQPRLLQRHLAQRVN